MGCCNASCCQFSSMADSEESDSSSSTGTGLLNINEATVEDLMALPGIGRRKAESIAGDLRCSLLGSFFLASKVQLQGGAV
ncbi:unnamed protein product [Symbiodinium necroappetens]|uniref:Uncharacterized protein n=1 Tax=Symbiodinium necroappetens TaxID=1628268 RepID=A0A812NI68_9DINO|nr:unnamed protein product [Symbiodinium necroappetens]